MLVGPSPSASGYIATVEPDVDNDGFGDETQDKCPSKATPTRPGGICADPPPPPDRIAPAFNDEPSVKSVTQSKTARLVVDRSEAGSISAKINVEPKPKKKRKR